MMKTLKFKSTIKCNGCINTVTPALNGLKEINKWEVDLQDPNRTLTVSGEAITPAKVKEALAKVGYQADLLG